MTICNPHHLRHAIRLALLLVFPFTAASLDAAEQADSAVAKPNAASSKPYFNPWTRKTALVMLGTKDSWHMRLEQVNAFAGLLTGFCKLSPHFSSVPEDFTFDNIRKYDVVVLYTALADYSRKKDENVTKTALENIFQAVQAGTPLLSFHGGIYNTSIDGRPKEIPAGPEVHEIERQVGAKYFFDLHYPFQEFKINISKEHPITKGVTDFMVADEIYMLDILDPAAEILATYDARSVKKSDPEKPSPKKQMIIDSIALGNARPQAPALYARTYCKGKIVVNILGHNEQSMCNPSVIKLYQQSFDWLFSGK